METVIKLIKALFFTAEGEVEKSATQKIKEWLLMFFIVEHLVFAGMWYLADEEDGPESVTIESVE